MVVEVEYSVIDSRMQLNGSNIFGSNSAALLGGGIYMQSSVFISRETIFSYNCAMHGGGIACTDNSKIIMKGSTILFFNNSANGHGNGHGGGI